MMRAVGFEVEEVLVGFDYGGVADLVYVLGEFEGVRGVIHLKSALVSSKWKSSLSVLLSDFQL